MLEQGLGQRCENKTKEMFLLKPFRSGESLCVGLKQVPYFKRFLVLPMAFKEVLKVFFFFFFSQVYNFYVVG